MKKRSAFLLIDVLLTMLIFMSAFSYILQGFRQAQLNFRYTSSLNEALRLAKDSLESCQSPLSRKTGTDEIKKGSVHFVRNVIVQESSDHAPLVEAIVQVSWQQDGQKNSCELRTLVFP